MAEVHRAVVLPVARQRAWVALTDTTLLRQWLGCEVELELRPGGRGRVRGADGTVREVLVQGVTPERSLRFHWWRAGDVASTVDIELDDEDGGTRVTVTETLRPTFGSAVKASVLARA